MVPCSALLSGKTRKVCSPQPALMKWMSSSSDFHPVQVYPTKDTVRPLPNAANATDEPMNSFSRHMQNHFIGSGVPPLVSKSQKLFEILTHSKSAQPTGNRTRNRRTEGSTFTIPSKPESTRPSLIGGQEEVERDSNQI